MNPDRATARCCPRCGYDPTARRPAINDGRLAFGDEYVQLSGHERIVADALVRRFNLSVSYETLIAQMYAMPNSEPDYSFNILRIIVSRLRRKLLPLGLGIHNDAKHGYRLSLRSNVRVDRRIKYQ